jgi:hypothetical protein
MYDPITIVPAFDTLFQLGLRLCRADALFST